jgi:hypothetical protein
VRRFGKYLRCPGVEFGGAAFGGCDRFVAAKAKVIAQGCCAKAPHPAQMGASMLRDTSGGISLILFPSRSVICRVFNAASG